MEFLRPFMKDRVFSNAAYYEGENSLEPPYRNTSDDNTMDNDLQVQKVKSVQSSVSSFSGGDDVQEEIECRPDVTLLAQQGLLNQLPPDDIKDRISPTQSANDLTAQAMSQLEALTNIYQHPHGLQVTPTLTPPAKRRGRKRKADIDLVPQHHLLPQNMDRGQILENTEPCEDSLKLFFDSMYAAAKALPAPLQRLIRIKLFQTVTDAEMAAENMPMERFPNNHTQW